MIPTGIDEFLAEHKIGDTVSGRVIDLDSAAQTPASSLAKASSPPAPSPAPTPPNPTPLSPPTPRWTYQP